MDQSVEGHDDRDDLAVLDAYDLPALDTRWLAACALAAAPYGEATSAELVTAILERLGDEERQLFSAAEGPKRLAQRTASALKNLRKQARAEIRSGHRWALTESGLAWVRGAPALVKAGARRTRALRRAGRLRELWTTDLATAERPPPIDLGSLATAQLVRLHRAAIVELKQRGDVRTSNVVGEWAERLTADALGGHLAAVSRAAWDVDAPEWGHVQVKARVVTDPSVDSELELGIIRSQDPLSAAFDHLAAILFDTTMRVRVGILVPAEVVGQHLGPWTRHDNGRKLYATDAVIFHDEAVDIAIELRAAERAYECPPEPD